MLTVTLRRVALVAAAVAVGSCGRRDPWSAFLARYDAWQRTAETEQATALTRWIALMDDARALVALRTDDRVLPPEVALVCPGWVADAPAEPPAARWTCSGVVADDTLHLHEDGERPPEVPAGARLRLTGLAADRVRPLRRGVGGLHAVRASAYGALHELPPGDVELTLPPSEEPEVLLVQLVQVGDGDRAHVLKFAWRLTVR